MSGKQEQPEAVDDLSVSSIGASYLIRGARTSKTKALLKSLGGSYSSRQHGYVLIKRQYHHFIDQLPADVRAALPNPSQQVTVRFEQEVQLPVSIEQFNEVASQLNMVKKGHVWVGTLAAAQPFLATFPMPPAGQ